MSADQRDLRSHYDLKRFERMEQSGGDGVSLPPREAEQEPIAERAFAAINPANHLEKALAPSEP